jgi:hypothetical protein
MSIKTAEEYKERSLAHLIDRRYCEGLRALILHLSMRKWLASYKPTPELPAVFAMQITIP